MVTLVAEDGTGLSNANSYVTLAYADDYFSGHPFYADNWAALTPDRKTALLVAGSRALDVNYVWRGQRMTTAQAMDWPRSLVYDDYDTLLPDGAMPARLLQAACEMAFYLTKGDTTVNAQAQAGVTDLKIDVIELKFSGATTLPVVSTTITALLRGLGEFAGGLRVRKLLVG